MNDPSSDGNDLVIDIFVLCKSETDTPLKTEYLEQKGYHVTLFSESTQLLETLRFGKPNLLICDSLSLGPEAFAVCRQIKADNELWMIPVLIMTSASSLSDLLFVLDCNADNFIAYPYEPSYLLSLIEGMLVTPVERQTPEQIKTQFKIQHDEHMFVVTADRRKLLEFLLSSFEIAVNKSDELVRAHSENLNLRNAAEKAADLAADQERIIDIINATLQQKEQAISKLNDEVLDKASQIADLTREKGFFLQEREADKALLAAAEDRIQALLREKEETAATHGAEVDELNRRIASLSRDLSTMTADRDTTKGILEQETIGHRDTEAALAKLVPEKEQLEKALRTLTLEHEQLRSFSSQETGRAQAAEQEAKSLLQAKAESEQDLTRIIDELKATARQQAGDLITLRDERTADKNRIGMLEAQIVSLASEKEQVESDLTRAVESLRTEISDLRSARDTVTAALDEKTREYAALEEVLREQKRAGEEARAQAGALGAELAAVQAELEERSRGLAALGQTLAEQKRIGEAAQAESATLGAELAAVRAELEERSRGLAALGQALAEQKQAGEQVLAQAGSLEIELLSVRSALEEKTRSAAEFETFCHELKTAATEALHQIQTLDAEIADLRAALEGEKEQHAATRTSLQGALRERDSALSSLQGAHEEVKSDLSSHRDNLVQAHQELAAAADERASLSSRLGESLAQIRALEEKLHAASGDQAESDKQIRSLADELEQVKAALETERRQRRTGEESARNAALAGEKAEEMVRQARQELERSRAMLESEQEGRRNAEERLRDLEQASEIRIQDLTADLDEAAIRRHGLEEQVRVLAREKLEAENHAASLEAEIEQARSALADEWEDHMTDNERYATAVVKTPPAAEPVTRDNLVPDAAGSQAVVIRTSALPAEVPAAPHALVNVQTPQSESATPRVTGVEDLFEDDGDEEELPSVSIVRDPAPDLDEIIACPPVPAMSGTPYEEYDGTEPEEYEPAESSVEEPDADADIGEEPGSPDTGDEEDDESADEEDEGDTDDGNNDEEYSAGASSYSRQYPSSPGIAFDRTKWFDLLKWAHHSGALSQDQRLQIVRMGRLIQKGRRLTLKQDEQVREMIVLVQSLGYRFT